MSKPVMRPAQAIYRAALTGLRALALMLVALPLVAVAEQTVKLTVTATILKHASIQVLSQPTSVVVTAADIARGYVDVPTPTQVAVRNNSDGYMLDVASQGDFMRQMVVSGLGGEVQISPAGGLITQRTSSRGVSTTTVALAFRFLLSETAQQGTYAWPVRLAVAPL